MFEKPLVSVIIPAFNAAKYIKDTLNSVLLQTWDNLEIVIVNDGSTDDTEIIIHEFLEDKRIKYVSQINKGCSGAKNAGLRIATGDFIQYLDADDILSKDKIERQIEVLLNKPFDIAVSRTKIFHEVPGDSDKEIDSDFLYSTENIFEFMLNLYGSNGKYGMIQPNAFLISRQLSDAIGDWDMTISPSPDEDGEYFCRAMLKSNGIHFTEGINYYRKELGSKKSLSNQHNYLHAKGALGSLILKSNHLLAKQDSEHVKKIMAVHFASFIYTYNSSYKDLCQQAETYIYGMGLKKIPNAGGAKFQKIASLIGFKKALRFKNIFS